MKMSGMKFSGARESARRWTMVAAVAALTAVMSLPGTARAVVTTYTDFIAFSGAISGAASTSTLNFDGLTAFDTIASGGSAGGITFNYNFGNFANGDPILLEVGTGFDTVSGTNYLGTNDAGVLQGGDIIDLSFAASNAIGMFFVIAPDPLQDGDLTLTVDGNIASLIVGDLQNTLGDGGLVYFLGLVDDMNTFTSASIGGSGPFFLWNADDITTANFDTKVIPLPPALPLFAAGLAGLWAIGRRRKRHQA